jgi:hypothetical protein
MPVIAFDQYSLNSPVQPVQYPTLSTTDTFFPNDLSKQHDQIFNSLRDQRQQKSYDMSIQKLQQMNSEAQFGASWGAFETVQQTSTLGLFMLAYPEFETAIDVSGTLLGTGVNAISLWTDTITRAGQSIQMMNPPNIDFNQYKMNQYGWSASTTSPVPGMPGVYNKFDDSLIISGNTINRFTTDKITSPDGYIFKGEYINSPIRSGVKGWMDTFSNSKIVTGPTYDPNTDTITGRYSSHWESQIVTNPTSNLDYTSSQIDLYNWNNFNNQMNPSNWNNLNNPTYNNNLPNYNNQMYPNNLNNYNYQTNFNNIKI